MISCKLINKNLLVKFPELKNFVKTSECRHMRSNFLDMFLDIILNLLEDKEHIKLNSIKNHREIFRKIVLDDSELPAMKEISLTILSLLDDRKRFEIAFQILQKDDNTYEKLFVVTHVLKDYACLMRADFKDRLYKLARSENAKIKKRALDLLIETRSLTKKN